MQCEDARAQGEDRERHARFQVFHEGDPHRPPGPLDNDQVGDGAEECQVSCQG